MNALTQNFKGDMPVAAVQMDAKLADIDYNIGQAGDLASKALERGARIVALPEFFTTSIVYDERLFGCSLPPENPAVKMMQSLATRHEALIGGSYLEMRNGDVYNTYVLVEPDGTLHRHDKDLPTMAENAFYTGGNDDGHHHTSVGRIGVAVCWETIRTATARRLTSKTDLLMSGSHWWTEPGWSFPKSLWTWVHQYNSALMERTPALFASMVGAPMLHAAHCGKISGTMLLGAGLSARTTTQLMAETQIVNSAGNVVARRTVQDGPGLVEGRIRIGAVPPRTSIPSRFWIDDLPLIFKLIWLNQNHANKPAYQKARKNGVLTTFKSTK
jgi:predicted amidohydrolase